MRCLLLLMTLATLASMARFEAAQEFRQIEEGVYVLGPEEDEESGVLLQPEADERLDITVRPEEGKRPIIIGRPEEGERPIIVVRPQEGERPIIIVRPQAQGEEEKGTTRSNNINMGTIGLWDYLLAHYNPRAQAVANQVVSQIIPFQGAALTRISFIRAIQTSGQLATARIIGGGLGMNFVTIRLTSARGSGFQYSIDIWGR